MRIMHENLNNDITIIIKTFKRYSVLIECFISIRKLYPKIKIIILNDDEKPITNKDFDEYTKIINTEFDIGLSEGRNRLIEQVETKYFLLLDDDSIFINEEETNLEIFYNILENTDLTIIGGMVDLRYGYHIIEEKGKGRIFFENGYKSINTKYNYKVVDSVLNFFLAKTEEFRKYDIKWDPILKVAEHNMFFYKIWRDLKNIKIGFTDKVRIKQSINKRRSEEYCKFRNRAVDILTENLHRYGITYLKAISGGEFKPKK